VPTLHETNLNAGAQMRSSDGPRPCNRAHATAGVTVPRCHILGCRCMNRAKRDTSGAKHRHKQSPLDSGCLDPGCHAHRFTGEPDSAPLKSS
jgi:hypothetical protein